MNINLEKLKREQIELSKKINLKDKKNIENVRFVGGIDVTFSQIWKRETLSISCIVVLDIKDNFKVVETAFSTKEVTFPYIPTFLAYRELPVILDAYTKLKTDVDVFLLDGMGILHPRRMGIASHFGVVTDTITVGCGKSKLTGEFKEPENKPLSYKPVYLNNDKVGYILRTKKNTNPIFLSPGINISVESSLKLVLKCLNGYKLPEPIRLSHNKLQEYRRNI